MASTHDAVSSVVQEGIKAAPPLAVTAATFMGMSLQEWVYAATIAYTGLQAYVLVRDKIVRRKDGG